MSNLYSNLAAVKNNLGITGTDHDTKILRFLEAASRAIDLYCDRFFSSLTATRYITPNDSQLIVVPDLLSVTTLTVDSEGDGTYDGETWTEGTDFILFPRERFPAWQLYAPRWGNFAFSDGVKDYVKIVGVWGYGDGLSASPWRAISETATVADTTTTTVTMSATVADIVEVGDTILIASEQVHVTAVSGATVTADRAENGTTAAAQAGGGAAVSIARYPADVVELAAWLAGYEFKQRTTQGMAQEKIGDYFYSVLVDGRDRGMERILRGLQRHEVAA